ncbi:MAG: type IV pilus biogenesis/stability protein PilW, partial [Pseudomonadales bacterium]|nr:type IV pilus biogenesis/stability protein PilW [Pseudomonadales bacterium]
TFKADKQAEVASRVKAATDYLNQGNPEKAIVHLKRALELDPDSAPVHDTLAQVFWKSGEYELAEEHFRKAIGYDPQFSRARNNYAAFLYERGDTRGAVRELEHVVTDTLYESRAAAFANLGRAYQKLGETAKAEEALSRAVKMDRRQWPAMLELAQISYDRGDYDPATRYYEQFRRLAPRQTPRSLVLGIRLARLAGDRDAEASYSLQLKSMYPDSAEYREFSRTSSER